MCKLVQGAVSQSTALPRPPQSRLSRSIPAPCPALAHRSTAHLDLHDACSTSQRCLATSAHFSANKLHAYHASSARDSARRFSNGNSTLPAVAPSAFLDSGPLDPSPNASHVQPKVRVAVDVDEVLGRFVYKLNQFCEEKYGMEYEVSDYWVYEYAKVWGCSPERSSEIVHDFLESRHFTEGIPVIPGAFLSHFSV
eukprot:gene24646-10269_t